MTDRVVFVSISGSAVIITWQSLDTDRHMLQPVWSHRLVFNSIITLTNTIPDHLLKDETLTCSINITAAVASKSCIPSVLSDKKHE